MKPLSSQLYFLQSGLKEVLTEPSGLQVRIYYLECLAHASYIVEHDGKAVVIDPRRDVDAYIDVRMLAQTFSLWGLVEELIVILHGILL